LVPVCYITLGALGFVVAPLFEVFSLKGVGWLKHGVGALALGLVSYATVVVCLSAERLHLPGWVDPVGWVLLAVALLLLVYSLFIDIPAHESYVGVSTGRVPVKTGTYALVRHPAVLWYGLLLVSLILVSKARLLLIAAPVWFLMDVLYVVVQDRFLFAKMFVGYDAYRRETPMLIPTKRSVSACLRSISTGGVVPRSEKGR